MFKCLYVGGDGTNGQMGPDASYDQVQLSSQSGDVTIYTAVPSSPGKGGNGGKGGIGGLGGNSGDYVLMSFKNKDKKKSSLLEKSVDGPNGSPGVPGVGGRYGKTAVKKITRVEKIISLLANRFLSFGSFLRQILERIKSQQINRVQQKVIENLTENYMTDNYNFASSGEYQYTLSLKNRSFPSELQKIDTKSIIEHYFNFISELKKPTLISSFNSKSFVNRARDPSNASLLSIF
jgi:hypothetical protein